MDQLRAQINHYKPLVQKVIVSIYTCYQKKYPGALSGVFLQSFKNVPPYHVLPSSSFSF